MNTLQTKPTPMKDFPVTTLLLIIFVLLFVWQVFTGVDANNPSTDDLISWGANALALSIGNDPWRLLSAGFLHIGLMHLMFNSFAIYFFGQVAEPILGRGRYLALFLLSVVGGNLLNCYVSWQQLLDGGVRHSLSAGASGGLMGIGAFLLICALFNVQIKGMQLNLQSLLLIMAINLGYGFIGNGIDNAGHIGGALTGSVLGVIVALTWKGKTMLQSLTFWLVAIGLSTGFIWLWQQLHQQILPYLSAS